MCTRSPHDFYRVRFPWDAARIERLLVAKNIRYYSLQTSMINYYLDNVPGKHPLNETEVWIYGVSA